MSVRKPTASRLDPRIKKLQKILEDPKTDRDKTIETRKELKKLKASVQPNPLSALRKGIKPKKNVAAEARERAAKLHGITIGRPSVLKDAKKKPPKGGRGSVTEKPGERLKELKTKETKPKPKPKSKAVKKASSKKAPPRPAPPVNPGGKAAKLPRARKAMARLRPPLSPGQFPGRARPVAVKPSGGRGSVIEAPGARAIAAKLPKEIFGPTTKVRPTRKPVLRTPGSMDDAGLRTLVDAADAGRRSKKRPVVARRPKGVGDASGAEAAHKASQERFAAADAHIKERQTGRKQPVKKKTGFFDFLGKRRPSGKMGPSLTLAQLQEDVDPETGAYNSPYLDTVTGKPLDPSLFPSKEGGKIGKKKQGDKARKDESIAMRVKKKRTKKKLKASRDESYGKWGSKKGKGKITRAKHGGSLLVASLYD